MYFCNLCTETIAGAQAQLTSAESTHDMYTRTTGGTQAKFTSTYSSTDTGR